jgi:hypothetical protein
MPMVSISKMMNKLTMTSNQIMNMSIIILRSMFLLSDVCCEIMKL